LQSSTNSETIRTVWRWASFALGIFTPVLKGGQYLLDHGMVAAHAGEKLSSTALALNTLEALGAILLVGAVAGLVVNLALLTAARFIRRFQLFPLVVDIGLTLALLWWIYQWQWHFLNTWEGLVALPILLVLMIQRFIPAIQDYWYWHKPQKYAVSFCAGFALALLENEWEGGDFFGSFRAISYFEFPDWLAVAVGAAAYAYMIWYFYSFIAQNAPWHSSR